MLSGVKSKNILVTGANGQLGRCLRDRVAGISSSDARFYFTDIEELDICELESIRAFVDKHCIGAIINTAAYTAVDKAEEDIEQAYRVNRDAVGNLARVCAECGCHLIHISTDYVFSGEACHPYSEEEAPAPKSIYGKSKLAGEAAIQASGCHATILRTSWLYSEYGRNFVKTMLELGSQRDELTVVSDQIGGATYAGDLAAAILRVLEVRWNAKGVETYHYANEGVLSWFDFSNAIMEIAGMTCRIRPVFSSEYPSKAERPSYSVFNLSKIKHDFGLEIPYWRESLILIINKLKA